jgi:hypothetical protein
MVAVARIFRDVLDGNREHEDATRALSHIYPDVPFANGFVHAQRGAAFVANKAEAGLGAGRTRVRSAGQ